MALSFNHQTETISMNGTTLTVAGSGAVLLPTGNTASQPSPANGMIRYNTQTNKFEGVISGSWTDFEAASGTYVLKSGDSMSGNLTMTGTAVILNTAGSTANTAYSFDGDPNTGIYSPGADQFAIVTGGTARITVNAATDITTALVALGPAGSNTAPTWSFSGDINSGVYSVGADVVGITAGGTLNFQVGNGTVRTIAAVHEFANGSNSAPSVTFNSDPNTGIYNVGADQLGITTNSTLRVTVNTTNVVSTLPTLLPDGTNTAPAYAFSNQNDTGMYLAGSGILGFSVDTAQYFAIRQSRWTYTSAANYSSELFVLRNSTTDATPTELFTDGSSGRLAIASDTTTFFKIIVTGRRTDADGESCAYEFNGIIDNDAGTTALVGNVSKTVYHEDTTAWDAAVTADNTNDAVIVTVTGEAAKTIRWIASAYITTVTG